MGQAIFQHSHPSYGSFVVQMFLSCVALSSMYLQFSLEGEGKHKVKP